MSRSRILPVELATGELLKCSACGHDRFAEREAQLNTSAATFFGFDWANRSATCYVCGRCGHIEWFLLPPPPPETAPS